MRWKMTRNPILDVFLCFHERDFSFDVQLCIYDIKPYMPVVCKRFFSFCDVLNVKSKNTITVKFE